IEKHNNLSSTDSTNLVLLANACPLNDGAIVYSARALLRDITGRLIVYSDACSGSGGSARMLKGETTQSYTLLPNPNHGQFELRQMVLSENPVQVEVTDVLGRNIYRKLTVFQNGGTQIYLGDIVPGLYCITLLDETTISTLKFVVQ
ncbi:MAG: T9SS type A sorting domain-containing protein, partial [Bacteroidetes bacterium]|nr:T9SS type A sorting domain-containing protein [Bacteroidota bacterium]